MVLEMVLVLEMEMVTWLVMVLVMVLMTGQLKRLGPVTELVLYAGVTKGLFDNDVADFSCVSDKAHNCLFILCWFI